MPQLLIVDDEPNLCYSLAKSLRSDRLQVTSVGTARRGVEMVRECAPDVIILDVCLPDMSGLEALGQIHDIDPHLPVIVITASATVDTAIGAMKCGAFDYLLKPVDLFQLRELVGKAVELSQKRHLPAGLGQQGGEAVEGQIVGRSAAMQEVYKAIGRVAAQDVSVLIEGESGTGKELVACAIYHHSSRRQQPFLAINCAALPETLLESELFGHERGAFTGADRQRIGKFEQANHGTLFLDEIGDMSPATQAKVLRLLQEQRFERLGGNQTVQADVRVIAATNKSLDQLAATGRFRTDLLYRLNAFTIPLPPLRDRLDDIPSLVEQFTKLFGPQFGKKVRSASPEFLRRLGEHSWPGNVRELQNIVKYALIHSAGETLTPASLPKNFRQGASPAVSLTGSTDRLREEVSRLVQELLEGGELDLYRKVLRLMDSAVLAEVLAHTGGNQVQAGEILGISRTTLRAKLHALGLAAPRPDWPGCEPRLARI